MVKNKIYRRLLASTSALAGLLSIQPAIAQQTEGSREDAASSELLEITVTAQRRSQPLQDVPVVVTAITAETLTDKGITSTSDLSLLSPGLTNFVANGFVMPSLRGVGTQNDSAGSTGTVAVYLDGVYLASPEAALFAYNNIEQVEVDKGPQGTLFGRNATAGVIQVKTLDPQSTFGGHASVGTDNYNTPTGDFYVTGPVAQGLVADLAVHYNNQLDGYGKNLFTGNDVYKSKDIDARSKWMWRPTENDRITAIFDYEYHTDSSDPITIDGTPYDYGVAGITTRLQSQLGGHWNIYSSADPTETSQQGGASIEVQHDFGVAQLTDIAAYRRSTDFIFSPTEVAPYNVAAFQNHDYKQVSEELRLASAADSKVNWVTGFYYLTSTATDAPYTLINSGASYSVAGCTAKFCPPYTRGALGPVLGSGPAPTGFIGLPPSSDAILTLVDSSVGSTSYAGFAQATVPLDVVSPSLNLTAGLRYTSETETSVGEDLIAAPGVTTTQPEASFSKLTYKAGLDYHFAPHVMGYATYSTGFQAGFFNANTPTAPASKPQTIDDTEVGVKSSFLDKRIVLDVGGFFYDYKNIVEPVFVNAVATTTNGPAAKLHGLDLDSDIAFTDHFRVSASAEYLHAKWTSYPNATSGVPASASNPNFFCVAVILCNPLGGVVSTTFDATGNKLPYAPDYVVSISPSYRHSIGNSDVRASATYYYNSGWYNDAGNTFHQVAYNTVGADVEWRPDNVPYSVRIWGKNLTDTVVYSRTAVSAPFGEYYALSPPRTYGITFNYQF